MTIRRILVPTNFDEGSTATLKYAVGLASRFQASVHVLHIVEPAITGRPGVIDGPTAAHRMRAAERRLRKSIPRIAGIQFGVDRDIGVGDPADRIVASAREELADVIVMTCSHTATRESRGPCIVDRVMHAAPCPVITLPQAPDVTRAPRRKSRRLEKSRG